MIFESPLYKSTKKEPPRWGVSFLKTNPNLNTNAPPIKVRGCKLGLGWCTSQIFFFLKNDFTLSMKFSSCGNGSSKIHGSEMPVTVKKSEVPFVHSETNHMVCFLWKSLCGNQRYLFRIPLHLPFCQLPYNQQIDNQYNPSFQHLPTHLGGNYQHRTPIGKR